ncbi:MAG: acyl-CoA dehydrogenase [Deltaproteobacteria bacterium]|nr:acyl-CoA dehydrogenase [Deltaproteobacteria bacterium]TDJ03381.1 MAG: acyl-CoA dehydrogenase [Deltaproteobacteria bacterium]TDJ04794.1 MAG: acyl-CoA dehydrogenase [Deltaproteobacteria bacterium]
MDFELNDDQRAILEAVGALLERHAGAERAIALAPKSEYDHALEEALHEAGFLELALGEGTGPLEAVLVVEAVARAGGVVAFGAGALVAPGVAGRSLSGPVAMASAGNGSPIRYGAHARSLLLLDADEASWITLEPGDAEPVRSSFGYPMGRVRSASGDSFGRGSGERMRNWWRVALAAEAVGTMDAALSVTIDYVKQRRQFGRTIGSFQAVQHRLAECAVLLEGSRWLVREAACLGAPSQAAAAAAAHATAAANRVFTETHQVSGAIGYTREHDLHVWSMRLQALRLEFGSIAGHQRALAEARWGEQSR